jgi:hypothetical protein
LHVVFTANFSPTARLVVQEPDGGPNHVPAVPFDQQPARADMRLVEGFAKIEDRRKGNVLIGEPVDPLVARPGGEGCTQEIDEVLLFARRRQADSDLSDARFRRDDAEREMNQLRYRFGPTYGTW